MQKFAQGAAFPGFQTRRRNVSNYFFRPPMSPTHPNTPPDAAHSPPEASDTAPDALVHHHLASAEETLRQITHGIAHDLQSSLRHVASYAGLLAERIDTGDVHEAPRLAQKVLGASRQMQSLLDAMRSLAQVQRSCLQRTVVDSIALVHGLREELLLVDGPTPLWQVDPFLPTVHADALLLRQVWRHLLHNALRFSRTADEPRISVGWQPVPQGLAFFVHDNGCGFEQEHAARLFSLFQRLQPVSGEAPGGLGAGLALVRRIVDCHGGRVWASARPGQGATFGFSLPLAVRA